MKLRPALEGLALVDRQPQILLTKAKMCSRKARRFKLAAAEAEDCSLNQSSPHVLCRDPGHVSVAPLWLGSGLLDSWTCDAQAANLHVQALSNCLGSVILP